MTLRSQTIALVVLFAALAIVFVLVGDSDVSTGVYLPDPTITPIPPTPTPEPSGSAEVWTPDETQEGVWTYSGEEAVDASISHEVLSVADAAARVDVAPPEESTELPGLAILDQFRLVFEEASASAGAAPSGADPFAYDGPVIRLFGGVPVAIARLVIQPAVNPNFPDGVDVSFAMIDQGEDEISYIQYTLVGAANDALLADFEAWLNEQAPELTAPDEDAEAEDEAPAEDAEAEDEAPAEDAEAEDEAPADDAEPAEDAEAEDEAPADNEEPAEDAEAEDEAPADDEEPVADDAEDTAEDEAPAEDAEAEPEAVAPTETWMQLGEGQYIYAANPNAMIIHGPIPVDQFAEQLGLEAPPEGEPVPLLDYLEGVRLDFVRQLEELGYTVEDDTFEGPELEEIGDFEVALLRTSVPAIEGEPEAADPADQPVPAQELAMALIDLGTGQVQMVQMVFQGDPDPAIYADYRTWLEENIEMLATGPETAPPAEDEAEAEEPAEDDAPAEDEAPAEDTDAEPADESASEPEE